MSILKFKQFIVAEFQSYNDFLKKGQVYKLKLQDLNGEHNIECVISEFGMSLHREITHYQFSIINSDSKDYPIDGEIILGINFDGQENQFNLFPFYNSTGKNRLRNTERISKKAHIELK
jgi:hypothetical protein